MDLSNEHLTQRVIGAAIEVHRQVGPGLLESTYEDCLTLQLASTGIAFERQIFLPLVYKSECITRAYKIDFLIEKSLILELKSVEKLLPVHQAQVLTYLRLAGLETGLLINFNCVVLKDGIRRLTNKTSPSSPPSCT